MNGSNAIDAVGVYDTQGTENAINMPGARYDYAIAQDFYGNPYIFGGVTKLPSGNDYQSDVWKYNNVNNRWTWLSGTAAGKNFTVSGTKGTSAPANQPSARYGSAAWFTGGNLWIMGGFGYTTTISSGTLNDMWGYVTAGGFSMISLPVRFGAFTAQKQASAVLLRWSTAQESNSAYFVVERSANGIGYDSIGKVAASGNTTVLTSYIFTDRVVVAGSSFYRLKQVDLDGRAMYSKVVTVNRETQGASLTILGNPVEHALKIAVDLDVTRKLTVLVKNVQGMVLFSRQYPFGKGETMYTLSTGKLSAGAYYVSLEGEGIRVTKPFVVQGP